MTLDELRARSDVFVVISDEDGFITHANDAAASSLGWRGADLVGEPLSRLIPSRLHDAHNLGFARFLATGAPTLLGRALHLDVLAKNGREVPSEHFLVAERTGGKWVFGAMITPRTSGGSPAPGKAPP